MASSYTSRIRLTKQGDGDNPNTWGTVLNNQVIDIIDDAIASYTTVCIGGAATVTLTENQGAADEARSAILHFKGSVGGSFNTISLIIPAKSKQYVVNNAVAATDAATDIVKMKTAGGDGYDIPFGSVGLVICDGTSVQSVNSKGLSLGTAASADIGISTTLSNLPNVNQADIRYVRVSTSQNASLIGSKFIIGASASTPVNFVVGKNARVYTSIVTVTDAACIGIDMALGNSFRVTVGDNRTLKKPTNCTVGQGGNIYIIQDGIGSRTLAYNTAWQFVSASVPSLSTGAGDVDMLVYNARSSATIDAVLLKNFDR